MTWEQQRAQILATIKSKKGKIGGIITKASNEKRSTDDDEDAEIKAVEDDIARLDANLARINGFIADVAVAADTATLVAGESEEEAGKSADGDPDPVSAAKGIATVKSNLKPGVGFAKAMRARVASQLELKKGNNVTALDIAKSRNEPEQVIRFLEKAVVMSTTEPQVEALLKQDNLDGEFIELLRARTIFDKLTGFRDVPFNVAMASQLTGSTAYWVGESQPKPTTDASFGTVKIGEHKLAAIEVFTDEFLRNAKPKSDDIFLEDLLQGMAAKLDGTFLSADAGDANKPAGILNGVTGIVSTGMTADTFDADIEALVTQFLIGNKSLAGAQFIMTEIMAYKFAKLRDALGSKYYPDMQGAVNEKSLEGVGVIESESAEKKITLIKPSEILLADDGDVDVSYSDQATIVNGADTINLWQQNMSAVRVERYISWAKRRVTAASFIQYT